MIAPLIILFAILSPLLDWYIYKHTPFTGKRWFRVLYPVHVVLLGISIVAALVFYRHFSNAGSPYPLQVILWVIVAFFLVLIPKLVYTVFSFFDYPLQWKLKRHVRIFKRIGIICAFAAFGLMVWGITAGRNIIEIKEIELESDKLPESFDGYRIAFFTDMHLGNLRPRSTLPDRVARKINELDPDIVVNGGDLVNTDARELNGRYMGMLGKIRAKDGIFSVLGNHDLGIYIRRSGDFTQEESLRLLAGKYGELGWRLMRNETVHIKRGNDSIAISGINYPEDHRLNTSVRNFGDVDYGMTYAGVSDSVYNIMISHTPDTWDDILAYGISDLTLSGHVHAMQMKLGFGDKVWSPARLMYKRWTGLYTEQGKHLYINDGLGYVMFPMRVNVYPEITLIVLRSTAKKADEN